MGAGASRRLTFHLIAHTHWDREWYLTRAAFLPRLVLAAGELLDLLEPDAAARFVLDGQTILVQDVLGVRPDWESRICAAATRRQLDVGPWYVLADELIPSGESLIRNLLLGARDTARFGARMPVLYSPDAFGHPGALPTLGREFGIDAGVVWRGLGASSGIDRDLYTWLGPDGAKLLLYHLPVQGYEVGAALAGPPDALERRWRTIRQGLVARAATSHVAVFVGADHHAPPGDPGSLRDRLQLLEPSHDVRLSSLEEYVAAVRTALESDDSGMELDEVAGELRWSYGYTWTLQGVHATRARLKRRHGAAELLLQRKAEPLAALAIWHGHVDQRAVVRAAWRTLVQCQFHDALCGCCSDPVAREQESRLASVIAMSREVARVSLHALAHHDPDASRDHPDDVTPTLLVWNPVPRPRAGIIVAAATCFRNDILVGPPSGGRPRSGRGFRPLSLIGDDGEVIPVQVLSVVPGMERIDAPRHYPDQDAVERVLLAFVAPPMPGMGLIGMRTVAGGGAPRGQGLDAHAGRMANRYLEVHAGDDGRVDMIDRRSGERYDDVLRLIDESDLGDCYTPWIPPGSPVIDLAEMVEQHLLAAGPLVAAVETRFILRSAGRGDIGVRRVLVLHADSPALRVRLEFDNRAIDHRLRLRVPVGSGHDAVAGAAFGYEWRPPVAALAGAFPAERPAPTAPAHRYVAAGAGDRGIVLLCPGFFEYEWTAQGELILTVQRSVGELSRDALPTRPGHAGWPMPTPEAQEIGPHHVELALAPLGDHEIGAIGALERLWEDVFLAPQPTFVRDFVGDTQAFADLGITLEGDGLIFTSLKPADAGRPLVLRCYSTEPAPVLGRWVFRARIAAAHRLRADETPIEPVAMTDAHAVDFVAPPRGLVTILVSPEEAR